jgi:hypothetical protein
MKRSKQNYFDLSNQEQLEQKYGIKYSELFAILAMTIKEQPSEIGDMLMTKENSPLIVVEITK